MIPPIVYVLCGGASLCCTLLLHRGWRRSGSRFLLWSTLSFAGLSASNFLLVLDLLIVPQFDLLPLRQIVTLLAGLVLVWGFVWDSSELGGHG